MALLAQMSSATGWNASSPPADAVATGTVTRTASQTTASLTLKIKGYAELRTDIQSDSSLTSTVINSGSGAFTNANGTQTLAPEALQSMWPTALPVFSDVTLAASDPNLAVTYVGPGLVNGQAAQEIQIQRLFGANDPLAAAHALIGATTVWLDPNTGFPVQVQYTQLAQDNPTAALTRTRQYSNYQIVSGIAVAMTQQDLANGQAFATLQLTSVTFNVGLSDADFAVPAGQ